MGRKSALVVFLILMVLVVDQTLKLWVKTHFTYGQEVALWGQNWALLHFVENDGMAFGIRWGGNYGKLALTLFRILAVLFLFVYLYELLRQRASRWLLVGFALIQGGAMGNIVDSMFYGVIFSESPYYGAEVAQLFPPDGGYAPLFYGRVVDMFYFPIAYGLYPPWVPWVGGEPYLFFRPVFNVADVAISTGVIFLLVWQLKNWRKPAPAAAVQEEE